MAQVMRKEQAKQTEQKIINAVIALLKDHSFHDLQIKMICSHAQTSIGNFYHHFPNKHSILIHILYKYSDLFLQKVEKLDAQPSFEKLIRVMQEFCAVIELLGSELVLELFMYNIISGDNFLLDSQRPLYQNIFAIINHLKDMGGLRSDDDADEITQNLIIFFRGFLYEWCLCKGSFDLSANITKQFKRYLILFK
ncbi:MAG: TetR/AcrR family transcriptional regulator [Treponemataceae bacterium]